MGSPLDAERLSTQERFAIVDLLYGIHQSGILHNDVYPENFVIKRDSQQFRVAFIDFAFATEISKIEECENEVDILTTILGIPAIRTKGKHQNSLLGFSSLNPYQDTADTVVRALEHFRLEGETSRMGRYDSTKGRDPICGDRSGPETSPHPHPDPKIILVKYPPIRHATTFVLPFSPICLFLCLCLLVGLCSYPPPSLSPASGPQISVSAITGIV